jgi:cytochrome c556
MKIVGIVGAVLVVVLGTCALTGHAEDPKDVSALMRKKLVHSQLILEGITVNDYEKIAKNAQDLITVSKAAEWKVLKTPEYEMYSNDLRRSAEALIRNAKDKNTDGAALAYVDLTLTCVKCHKHVREVRMAFKD